MSYQNYSWIQTAARIRREEHEDMARKNNIDIETKIGIGLLRAAGLNVDANGKALPNAPVASPPTAVANVAQGKADAWERGFKIGKGLEPQAARPYAENVDGRVPHQLAAVAEDERADFDAGFVAGFQARWREYTGAQS